MVCPNPLSADSYSICEYNCRYCFISEMYQGIMKETYAKGLLPTNLSELHKLLKAAFGSRKESENLTVLALRSKLPVIIGRKCEPFCPSEAKYHNTKAMIKIFNNYGVKTFVECKGITTGYDDFSEIDIEKFATGVLVSVMPANLNDQHKLEPDAPGADERFIFAEKMKQVGLWVGLTSEPLLPTISDKENVIESYAQYAHDINVDHVNFGEYRAHLAKVSRQNLSKAGISLDEILQGMSKWKELGSKFMSTIKSYGIKCSTPDWINFGFDNDSEGCCGLSEFGVHKSTMQHAIQILKHKKKVRFSDIVDLEFPPPKELEKMSEIWNGDGKHYTLSYIENIDKVDEDSSGNAIYGITKQKSLSEVSG